ncbi:unnamed protein product [Cochlearia groenlandica]
MSYCMTLKPACLRCGSPCDLYGSSCRHMTLCFKCGKTMAENKEKCIDCGAILTRLIREKLKNRPWVLEDETGQFQYQGHLVGSQSATYYLLVMQNKELVAIPAGSWYNFNKVAQYKQLTLEEAEEKMKNLRKTADGYQRWMMKGEAGNVKESGESGGGGGRGRKKSSGGDEEEGNVSDRYNEDEEEEASRKSRLGLNKKSNDEEGPRGGDLDMDDDDIEKGDDWEHEEIFTDDDEEVGNDPEEREDLLAPEIPAPPEIKQDDEDEEGEGGLSKSGKELKKLLVKCNGLNESDDSDDKDAAKEERVDSSPRKPAPSGPSRGRPSAKPSKGKRKLNDCDSKKPSSSSVQKKSKSENDPKSNSVSKSAATGPVTEDEIRAFLMEKKQVTRQELVSEFKARLKTKEDKNAFADILRKISKMQKNAGSQNFVVLREK